MFRFLNTDYFPGPVTWTRRLFYIQSRFYLTNSRIKSHNLLDSLRAGVWTATNKIISDIWEKIEALLIEFRATWILQDNSHSSVLHQFQSRACFSHVFVSIYTHGNRFFSQTCFKEELYLSWGAASHDQKYCRDTFILSETFQLFGQDRNNSMGLHD